MQYLHRVIVHEATVWRPQEPVEIDFWGTDGCQGEVATIATGYYDEEKTQKERPVVAGTDAVVDPGGTNNTHCS